MRWRWTKVGALDTVPDGDRYACAACRTPVRSYQHRCHPPESPLYERCVGLAWCPDCRTYTADLVHVPRQRTLTDALAALPEDRRERIARSETRLIDFLNREARGTWLS